ncbi:DUF3601 domain-containing protein [Polyangium aurulentum]|uniref:DUF3601 domain-containing protein n=1 Tax=Polyangium aurulentum TaxID=2567896 RepID=UPI0010ADCA0C|nr:DUF3601 domain-containing protein [Polyangium aurulentum]UQA55513.1 DUF3601 domain-containing protein [Polyangium aurulentum]
MAGAKKLTVHELVPGKRYRVIKPFRDYHGHPFEEGELLTFASRDYLPYHDGHTIVFAERTMWLWGGDEVYADFDAFVAPA